MEQTISQLYSHDALILLHHSLAIPKLLHILCIATCFLSSCLTEYDASLCTILGNITNMVLSEAAWLQATLPVKRGGLGIRSAVHLATSAFLASASSVCSLHRFALPLILRWSQLFLLFGHCYCLLFVFVLFCILFLSCFVLFLPCRVCFTCVLCLMFCIVFFFAFLLCLNYYCLILLLYCLVLSFVFLF